jgi:hypothetical protein
LDWIVLQDDILLKLLAKLEKNKMLKVAQFVVERLFHPASFNEALVIARNDPVLRTFTELPINRTLVVEVVAELVPNAVPDAVPEVVATEVALPASSFTLPIFSAVKDQELKLLSSVSNDHVSPFVLKTLIVF